MAVSAFPSASTNNPGVYNLQLYFSGNCGAGWSEKFCVGNVATLGESVSTFTNVQGCFTLACLRAMLLGKGESIVWGRVSATGQSREALPILQSPILAIATVGETISTIADYNVTGDCLNFQLRDANGHFSTRQFRGGRDLEFDEQTWTNQAAVMPLGTTSITALAGITGGLPAFTTAQATGASTSADAQWWALNANASDAITLPQAWSTFLLCLETVTGYCHRITKRATGMTVGNYNTNPWVTGANGIIFRKCTTKKTGRVFGAGRASAPKSK